MLTSVRILGNINDFEVNDFDLLYSDVHCRLATILYKCRTTCTERQLETGNMLTVNESETNPRNKTGAKEDVFAGISINGNSRNLRDYWTPVTAV